MKGIYKFILIASIAFNSGGDIFAQGAPQGPQKPKPPIVKPNNHKPKPPRQNEGGSILTCNFRNQTIDGEELSVFGAPLYASDMRILTPCLIYNGPSEKQNKTLYVKMFDSDGSLLRNNNAPSGYSYREEVVFEPGNNNMLILPGCGDAYKSVFEPGRCKIEIYCDGSNIYSGSARIQKKSNESTFLKVDNLNAVTSLVNATGGTFLYKVSTDANDWTISSIPYFGELISKTPTSLTIKYQPNIGAERKGTMYVETQNNSVEISVKQLAGNGVKINRTWAETDTYNYGQKGVTIHVNFETQGLAGHELKPCVFFYHENEDKLLGGSNSRYQSPDGQVTIQGSASVSSDNSGWNDFTLFIPYSEFPAENINLKFMVHIFDATASKWAEISEYQTFRLGKIF